MRPTLYDIVSQALESDDEILPLYATVLAVKGILIAQNDKNNTTLRRPAASETGQGLPIVFDTSCCVSRHPAELSSASLLQWRIASTAFSDQIYYIRHPIVFGVYIAPHGRAQELRPVWVAGFIFAMVWQ
jgi:hypothetical protein